MMMMMMSASVSLIEIFFVVHEYVNSLDSCNELKDRLSNIDHLMVWRAFHSNNSLHFLFKIHEL